jgi:16S rRNA C967 or C1407 C5-methylase (RsmB/RsmF family)
VVPIRSRIEEMVGEDVLTAPAAERLQSCITPEGFLRLLPGVFRTDGFFIAMIGRTA